VDRTVPDRDGGAVFLEVEEVLRLDDREGALDVAALQQMAERTGGGVARIVPTFECENRARSTKRWSSKASYGVHDRKGIGRTP
jgi:hypothetical protein